MTAAVDRPLYPEYLLDTIPIFDETEHRDRSFMADVLRQLSVSSGGPAASASKRVCGEANGARGGSGGAAGAARGPPPQQSPPPQSPPPQSGRKKKPKMDRAAKLWDGIDFTKRKALLLELMSRIAESRAPSNRSLKEGGDGGLMALTKGHAGWTDVKRLLWLLRADGSLTQEMDSKHKSVWRVVSVCV